MRKGNVVALLIGFIFFTYIGLVSAEPSSFTLPKEALGNKTVNLELGKPLIWSSGKEAYVLDAQSTHNGAVVFSLEIGEQSYRFLLAPGQSFGIDLNRDSLPDGSVTLVSIEEIRVKVLLSSRTPQAIFSDTIDTGALSTSNDLFFFMGVGVLVLVILLILTYVIWMWVHARNEVPSESSVTISSYSTNSESVIKTSNAFSK